VHHVGILYDQFMMHGQRNIKSVLLSNPCISRSDNVVTCYQCVDGGSKGFLNRHRHVYLRSGTG